MHELGSKGGQYWQSEAYISLGVRVRFVRDLIEMLSTFPTPTKRRARRHELDGLAHVHQQVAKLVYEIIKAASRLRAPQDICWAVQYGAIWSDIFSFNETASSKLVAFYLRRLIYDEIRKMDQYANFVGAGILGYCLNVLGVSEEMSSEDDRHGFAPLRRTAVGWVKFNYSKLADEYPVVAEASLVGGISFDPVNNTVPIKF